MKGEKRKIVIGGERAINWQKFYQGGHWGPRSEIAKRMHALVRALLDPELPMFDGQIDVKVTAIGKGVIPDPDNVCDKVLIDGIKGWWVPDDTPGWIRNATTTSQEGPENCIILEAEQIGDPFAWVCGCCGLRWPSAKLYKRHMHAEE